MTLWLSGLARDDRPEIEDHQTFIDVVGLFKSFTLAVGFLGHFATCQIDKINFSVSAQMFIVALYARNNL